MFGYSVEDVAALTIEHRNGVVGNLVTVFNGVQHREERRLEVFFERASLELTTDFLVGAPEDSFLVHRADEPHASGTTSTRCGGPRSPPTGSIPIARCSCTSTSRTTRLRRRCATAGRRAPMSTTRSVRIRWSRPRTGARPTAGPWISTARELGAPRELGARLNQRRSSRRFATLA